MSYTPEEQLLEQPLEETIKSIDKLREPINKRLQDPNSWSKEHLEELVSLTDKLTKLQLELSILKTHVR